MVVVARTAEAQAPTAQGWWTSFACRACRTIPAPPDVGPTDLLVQGGDLGGAAPDLGLPTSPTALAALRFTITDGADVGALTLQVATGARATDVRAYPVKSDNWKPAQGGPLQDAPQADPRRDLAGVLNTDGTALVFRDIARLVPEDGSPLSVVLVPAATDRVVVQKPSATALDVSEPDDGASGGPDQGGFGAPPGSGGGSTSTSGFPGFSSGAGTGSGTFGTSPGTGSEPAPDTAGGVTSPPVVAGAPASEPSSAELALARLQADERTRYLVALEALLVLLTFGLLGWGPFRKLAALTGQPAEQVDRARGVGRFAQVRSGAVVRL